MLVSQPPAPTDLKILKTKAIGHPQSSFQSEIVNSLNQIAAHQSMRVYGFKKLEKTGEEVVGESLGVKWSYFVGQSEGKAKVDSDWF